MRGKGKGGREREGGGVTHFFTESCLVGGDYHTYVRWPTVLTFTNTRWHKRSPRSQM